MSERSEAGGLFLADGTRVSLGVMPVQDRQTVNPDGSNLVELIEGVTLRPAVTQADARGTLTEIFDVRWDSEEPTPFVYEVTLEPSSVRAWLVHLVQADRLFFSEGLLKLVLYDAREGSPSHGAVNELFFGSHRRTLVRIPPGVVHGVKNVGSTVARFVNLPSAPYQHEDPDKYRLPPDSKAVPVSI